MAGHGDIGGALQGYLRRMSPDGSKSGPKHAQLRGALLAAKNAQEMVGVRVFRVRLEDLQVVGLGARELARLVQGDALTEQG